MKPKVSVIIPTYNRLPMLKEAVDSVLAQDFEDFELIVVDDGSTDGTAEEIKRYGGRVKFLQHLRTEGSVLPEIKVSFMPEGNTSLFWILMIFGSKGN